ncbi:MAG: hypothetical protein Q9190_006798 [Brigantiaea leucoxantha]
MPPQRTLPAPGLQRASYYPPPDAADPVYTPQPYATSNAYVPIHEQNSAPNGTSSGPRDAFQQAPSASNYQSRDSSPHPFTRNTPPPIRMTHSVPQNLVPLSDHSNSTKPKKSGVACDECRKKKVSFSATIEERNGAKNATLKTKCDGIKESTNPTCSTCSRARITCLYTREPTSRGPKRGYIQDLGAQLQRLEDQLRVQEAHSQAQMENQEQRHKTDIESLHARIERLEALVERYERPLSRHQHSSTRDASNQGAGLQQLATAAAEDME